MKIGIFFGTETGTTRLIAKKLHKLLGDDVADKPLNVNRITPADMLQYDALLLGTPSYGVGQIPGRTAGCLESNWEEFLARLPAGAVFDGKRVAFFALGAQERYAERFASSLRVLHDIVLARGAEIVGQWSTEGYVFEHSASVLEGRFLGLIIDQRTQSQLTDLRLEEWLEVVRPQMLAKLAGQALA
ncbi:flavodoxin [Uliginosibacterium paludis]|uniref:Flavodoxin n=1 Tax=Uliginosibacterium paludis TaxID=1615952 RepID=A0ABV2CLJ8_9RHOO